MNPFSLIFAATASTMCKTGIFIYFSKAGTATCNVLAQIIIKSAPPFYNISASSMISFVIEFQFSAIEFVATSSKSTLAISILAEWYPPNF